MPSSPAPWWSTCSLPSESHTATADPAGGCRPTALTRPLKRKGPLGTAWGAHDCVQDRASLRFFWEDHHVGEEQDVHTAPLQVPPP